MPQSQTTNSHLISPLASTKQAVLLAMLCSLTFSCSVWLASSAAEREKTPTVEWILEQKSDEWGNSTLYVARNAVKVENHKRNFVFMATSRDAHQILFRPEEKIMAMTSEFNWEDFVPFVRSGHSHSLYTIEDNVSWKGLRCRKFIESPVAWCLVAKDIDLDPKLAEAVCMFYGMSQYPALPVVSYQSKGKTSKYKSTGWLKSMSFDYGGGGSHLRFDTTSWKKIPYRETDFLKPIGFRKVNPRDIVFSADEQSALESVINDVGFTTGAGRGKAEKKK